MFKVLGRLDMK